MLVFLSAAFVASAGFAADLVAAFISTAFVAGVAVVTVVAAAGAG